MGITVNWCIASDLIKNNCREYVTLVPMKQAIDAFIEAYSQTAHPFEWTKQVVHPGNLKHTYTQLCK